MKSKIITFSLVVLALMISIIGANFLLKDNIVTVGATAGESHNHASSADHAKCAEKIQGKEIPDITIIDTAGVPLHLVQLSMGKPILIVRYLGYSCSHCVQQLIEINKVSKEIEKAGNKIIAFSKDPSERNRALMSGYGFNRNVFTFASDPANIAADKLGAIFQERDGSKTDLHVAMIIDKGKVTFANFDVRPYPHIDSLMMKLGINRTSSVQ